ncbi:MAG: zinc-ribbon domain-containing protein [Novosphingobium sp.]|nr:zinc-ribbon domain-containing protein [Novosphingobium sp.]
MIIACPACNTRYAVPDDAIGLEGRTVRCAKCRHSWFQEGPELEMAGAGAAPAASRSEEVQQPAPEPVESGPQSPATADVETAQPAEPAADPEIPAPQAPEPEAPVSVPESLSAPAPSRSNANEFAQPADASASGSSWSQDDDDYSTFDHAAPFRPRRNVTKLLMIAAVIFAVVVLGATAWVWRFGLPGWVPATSATFAEARPELVLDFPPNRQARRTLPDGTEFFEANGTVTNVGAADRSVPSILIVMRDARERIVYRWEVVPPKRRLSPGESVTINEAVTDVPKSAVAAEIGWKPG